MDLEMDGLRRLLAHLPPWRDPDVAEAWSAHEGAKSVTGYTAQELTVRIDEHDPHVTFDVVEVPELLEDLRASGLATVDETGGWSQTEAGMDLLTNGGARAHSQRVAAAIAEQGVVDA